MGCEGNCAELNERLDALLAELKKQGGPWKGESNVQLGNEVNPTGGGPGSSGAFNSFGIPVDAVWAEFKTPKVVTLSLSASSAVTSSLTPGFVKANILTAIGNAYRTRTVPVTAQTKQLQVIGRSIYVNFQVYGNAGTTVPCFAQISTDTIDDLEDLWPVWVPSNGSAPGPTKIFTGACTFLSASGFLTAQGSGDAADYFMLFDQAATPGVGATPLLTLGPLTTGTPFSVDKSLRGSVRVSTALWWALSSTTDSYTPAGSGGEVHVDLDYGI
jgi:hypothetical protein